MTRRLSALASIVVSFAPALLGACDAPSAPPSPGQAEAEPEVEPEDDLDQPAPAPAPEECHETPAVLPRVVFVLDRWSSMDAGGFESGEPRGPGERSRWALLHAAVTEAATVLEGEAQLGAVLFPSSFADINRDAACDALSVPEVPVGPYTARQLLKRLPRADATGFYGGSPVQAAYTTALEHLATLGEGVPAAIVLVTDGGANCVGETDLAGVPDPELAELVAFARSSRGISTFAVGVDVDDAMLERPLVNPDAALREIARAGGVARGGSGYFSANNPAPLVEALAEFAASAQVPARTTCP